MEMSMSKKKAPRKKRKKYQVDIITPVYGGAEYIEALAPSLLEQVDAGIDFHWILVDDATPPERGRDDVLRVLRELKAHEDITVVENKVNGGFSKANNIGVRKGRAKYILLLNSDTLMKEDGWLLKMVETIESHPLVAVVGARMLFFEDSTSNIRPPGTVQHAGVVFNMLKQPYHIYVGWPADHPRVMQRRVMQCVTGACLMTRRKVWNQLGGLNEVYGPGNFEDVEYCVHAVSKGYLVMYEPEACIYHYAGGSDNTETAIRNEQIFRLRNQHLVEWDEWLHY
jgi:GT2 family glycosyltransferase